MLINIRCATKNDIKQLASLWRKLVSDPEASDQNIIPCDENVERWSSFVEKIIREDPCQILVAEDQGNIVGYILYVKKTRTNLLLRMYCASIYDLYVLPQYRGRGIGKKLLEEAINKIGESGIECIELSVWIKNTRAINLYRRHGFKNYVIKMRKILNTPR